IARRTVVERAEDPVLRAPGARGAGFAVDQPAGPRGHSTSMARSDAARNAAFQIQVAVRRAVQGGSAVLRTDPRTARASLARRPWAPPRISPGPRRAPSSIAAC